MDNIIPENEFVEVEGRQYINPQTGLDESTQFIENLRATQGQQNQQIASDTYNLGTDIPSVQGGLGTNTVSDMGYFTSRYQVPQTNSAVANLRAVAQAQALNDVLSNEQAIWKKRYQDAYRNYQKSAYNRAYSGGGGGGDGDAAGKGDAGAKSTSKTVGSVEKSFSPLDFSGSYLYNYEPNKLGSSLIGNININPSGPVSAIKDSAGNVTSLTYNGKTFSGEAAQKRYDYLQSAGTMTRVGG